MAAVSEYGMEVAAVMLEGLVSAGSSGSRSLFTTDCNGTSYDGVRRDYCGTLRIKCSRYMGTPERICRTRAVTMIRQYIRKIEPVLWETNETGFCCRMRRKVKCRRNWSA